MQQDSQAPTGNGETGAVVRLDLQWPEHPDLHRAVVPQRLSRLTTTSSAEVSISRLEPVGQLMLASAASAAYSAALIEAL